MSQHRQVSNSIRGPRSSSPIRPTPRLTAPKKRIDADQLDELKEAFNQINRYQRHSFGANAALFQYLQIFIISNGVNTKYYANNRHQSFKQTFYWTDKENKRLTNILNGFTSEFLEPCHISKMICKYIVLNETNKLLMVLRPYQFYAVEALIDRVKNSNKNGYIWHTTGSGKTLTSFKASQILIY
jgi:type I restriction enzyme R subunit